ncbi:uncharacterized protein [Euwallacea fornicatus]|uniref:uncharacterized protein n=1 Tax=Euwallacea fornicatus TaxID=995702 RepID=UPI00338D9BD2
MPRTDSVSVHLESTRNYQIQNSNMEDSLGHRLAAHDAFAYNTLINVFKYLDFKDLLNCAQVCSLWYWIVRTDLLWRNVRVYSCSEHVCIPVYLFGSNLRHLEIVDPYRLPSESFAKLCEHLPVIKRIGLHGCNIYHLETLSKTVSDKLDEMSVEVSYGKTDWKFFSRFQNVSHLDITVRGGRVKDVRYFLRSAKLRHLKMFMVTTSVQDYLAPLELLESLCFNIGLNNSWLFDIFESNRIRDLTALTKLQIHNLGSNYHIMSNLKFLPCVKELILLQIALPPPASTHSIMIELAQIFTVTHLTISINRISYLNSILDIALENAELFEGIIAMKNRLKYFCWQIDESEFIRSEQYFHVRGVVPVMSYSIRDKAPSRAAHWSTEIMDIHLDELATVLQWRMPQTKVVLTKADSVRIAEKKRLSCWKCGKTTTASCGIWKN